MKNNAPLITGADARDAARYRSLRRKICIVGDKFHILNLAPTYVAPDAAIELDAAIDALPTCSEPNAMCRGES